MQFHKSCCEDLLNEDGLLIMGEGLDLLSILRRFISLYAKSEKNLVLVLNTSQEEQQMIINELSSSSSCFHLPKVINNETIGTDRKELYCHGGVLFMSPWILILDLLRKVCPSHLVNGLLVYHAEKITDHSQEAFIANVYRQTNRTGFIKAFSENATKFTRDFGGAERILRLLNLRKLYLYPRFHVLVNEELNKSTANVIEILLEMPPTMRLIHESILKCIQMVLMEIKKSTNISLDEITIEDSLFLDFDRIIRNKMDVVWNSISPKTRSLANELKTLRKILHRLLVDDCVSFLRFLESIKIENYGKTVDWMFTEEGNRIFDLAEMRVFKRLAQSGRKTVPLASLDTSSNALMELDNINNNSNNTSDINIDNANNNNNNSDIMESIKVKSETKLQTKTKLIDRQVIKRHVNNSNSESEASNKLSGNSTNPEIDEIESLMFNAFQEEENGTGETKKENEIENGEDMGDDHQDGGKKGSNTTNTSNSSNFDKKSTSDHVETDIETGSPLSNSDNSIQNTDNDTVNANNHDRDNTIEIDSDPVVIDGSNNSLKRKRTHPVSLSHNSKKPNNPDSNEIQQDGMGVNNNDNNNNNNNNTSINNTNTNDKNVIKIERTLEANPKWTHLKEILDEINANRHKNNKNNGRILIICKEFTSANQIKEILSLGIEGFLAKKFYNYLNTQHLVRQEIERKQRETEDNVSSETNVFQKKKKGDKQYGKHNRRNTKENKEKRQPKNIGPYFLLSEDTIMPNVTDNQIRELVKNATTSKNQGNFKLNALQSMTVSANDGNNNTSANNNNSTSNNNNNAFMKNEFEANFGIAQPSILVYVGINKEILIQNMPHYVILMDPEPVHVRILEVFKALNPSHDLTIYFVIHNNTAEDQRYRSQLKREANAFEKLIWEKSNMCIPHSLMGENQRSRTIQPATLSSRVSVQPTGVGTIVVDVREFRSPLPSVLFSYGFTLVPVTLEVGDYVLTPDIVIERKSIPDLKQSLQSGRLYSQVEAMTRLYKIPVLLIEFDEKYAFALTSEAKIKAQNININDISSKITLITMHFPRLRIIWCQTPSHVAGIFADLKQYAPEPKIDYRGEDKEPMASMGPVDSLKRLPYITSNNYRQVASKLSNLAELAELSSDNMEDLVGAKTGGKELYQFIHKKYKVGNIEVE